MDISLALGGGGSKGNAHIGVLRKLEAEGFKIRAIAGTSIGGLIGAVYLSGYSPEQMLDHFRGIDQNKLFGRERSEQPSLLGLAGTTRVLTELIGDRTFKDLSTPFAVTAVDLNTGKPVTIDTGSLIDAVLATIAVPGIFPARQWEDFLLVDGGIINPIPVSIARSLAPACPVVAVALTQLSDPYTGVPVPHISRPATVISYLSKLRVAQALDVFLRSMDISGRLLTELRLEVDNPDVIIRPNLAGIGLLDRVNIEEVVNRGEEAVEDGLDELKRVVGWPYRAAKLLGITKFLDRFISGEER